MEDVSAQDSPEVCPEEVEEGDEGEEAGKFLPQVHSQHSVHSHSIVFTEGISSTSKNKVFYFRGISGFKYCMYVCMWRND